ncbi:MAG: D-aminoacyl-tRNA deacylase [Paracoccaceae bacterium]
MLVNIQRVSSASVQVGENTIGSIGLGLLTLVCAMPGDTNNTCEKVAEKLSKIRVFNDGFGKMNRSLLDVNGSVLMVSQFTLAANTKSGSRPDFSKAMCPAEAKKIFYELVEQIKNKDIKIKTGIFGVHMKLKIVNDGPVTIPMNFS